MSCTSFLKPGVTVDCSKANGAVFGINNVAGSTRKIKCYSTSYPAGHQDMYKYHRVTEQWYFLLLLLRG